MAEVNALEGLSKTGFNFDRKFPVMFDDCSADARGERPGLFPTKGSKFEKKAAGGGKSMEFKLESQDELIALGPVVQDARAASTAKITAAAATTATTTTAAATTPAVGVRH